MLSVLSRTCKSLRVHCEVELEDGQVHVTDMDSGGGTFLNGKRIHEEYLKEGDVLQIGLTQLRLQGEREAERPRRVRPPLRPSKRC